MTFHKKKEVFFNISTIVFIEEQTFFFMTLNDIFETIVSMKEKNTKVVLLNETKHTEQ